MASLSDMVSISSSGLYAHQERLAVISNNVTNMQTEGYHRQTAVLSTNPANYPNLYTTIPYSMGTGVQVQDIIREYDGLRESVYLGENSESSKHEFLAKMLPDMQILLDETSGSTISDSLNKFWASCQDVAANPDNLAIRNAMLARANQLAVTFNSISSGLSDYRSGIISGTPPDVTGSLADEVSTINETLDELQKINRLITQFQATNVSTADLEDKRDLLVRDLSSSFEVDVDTQYNIRLAGQTLVSSDGATKNDLEITGSDPLSFSAAGTAVEIEEGTLGGYQELITYIDSIQSDLNTLAGSLISEVNTMHEAGYDLEGDPGLAFFTGTTAADIAVNTELYDQSNPLLNHPEKIAAAKTLYDPGGPNEGPNTGDGANILDIADLSRADQADLSDRTYNEFYTDLSSALGARIASEEDMAEAGEATLAMLDTAIQSESGVNLDQELVDMMSAQRAYQSSAKVLSTVNAMFDVLFSL